VGGSKEGITGFISSTVRRNEKGLGFAWGIREGLHSGERPGSKYREKVPKVGRN